MPGDLVVQLPKAPEGQHLVLKHCEFYVENRWVRHPVFFHYNEYNKKLEMVDVIDQRRSP